MEANEDMRRFVISVLSFFLLANMGIGLAGGFWDKKDYREWSKSECRRILEDSPWVQKNVFKDFGYAGAGIGLIEETQYVVRLYSALPVRQAIVRLSQISANYAGLPPEQQIAFDKSSGETLSSSAYSDKIVFSIKYSDEKLGNYWLTYRHTKDVFIYGNNGKRVHLIDYSCDTANSEFRFVFPRLQEGHPIITPEDKMLTLQFPTEHLLVFSPMANQKFQFKVNAMLFHGALEY